MALKKSDLIFLIGTNPRYEATILNARIRKSYLNNNTKIISLNDLGDLTYPYESLDGKTKTLKDIFDGNHEISKKIISADKPMIVMGESLLNLGSSKYFFNSIKNFLTQNKKISEEWNSFNILSCDASTVGNYDLGIINESNNLLEDLQNHKFDILYLMGQDNLNFDKKDEFIIYQGSHGDKGAEIADIILPGSAYTEQDGYFTNLEGKIQKAYKASYPPGDAKEDWQIINELAELMNNRKLFNDKEELESSMLNYLNLQKEKQINEEDKSNQIEDNEFKDEVLKVNVKDYYFSNVVARSSKTMIECNNSKINLKSTGTEG
jgi:NADH-quinone oxidoreductase subunit G